MTDTTVPGRACLHELASQRRLPAHQPMDQMTLGWITDNRPANFDAAPSHRQGRRASSRRLN
ncbi:hypothetical protein L1856_22510 [Streptomyces sp. Tue 6430]|nr:hypothetical protein [Streptomyces sp. Tue 6430]